MSFLKSIFIATLTAGLFSQILWANEDTHDKPAAEKPAEGHGEPKAEGHGEAKGEESKVNTPWMEIEKKTIELAARIKAKENSLAERLKHKKEMPANSPQLKAVAKDIVKDYKELQKMIEEYDKTVTLLKYRFPERNSKTKKKYERIEAQSLSDLEQAVGIDGKLNRNLKRMRGQFKAVKTKPDSAPSPPVEHVAPGPKEKSIEDEGALVIQK